MSLRHSGAAEGSTRAVGPMVSSGRLGGRVFPLGPGGGGDGTWDGRVDTGRSTLRAAWNAGTEQRWRERQEAETLRGGSTRRRSSKSGVRAVCGGCVWSTGALVLAQPRRAVRCGAEVAGGGCSGESGAPCRIAPVALPRRMWMMCRVPRAHRTSAAPGAHVTIQLIDIPESWRYL
jgi:hypothetical protein